MSPRISKSGYALDRGWIRAQRAARRHKGMHLVDRQPQEIRQEIARGPVRWKT